MASTRTRKNTTTTSTATAVAEPTTDETTQEAQEVAETIVEQAVEQAAEDQGTTTEVVESAPPANPFEAEEKAITDAEVIVEQLKSAGIAEDSALFAMATSTLETAKARLEATKVRAAQREEARKKALEEAAEKKSAAIASAKADIEMLEAAGSPPAAMLFAKKILEQLENQPLTPTSVTRRSQAPRADGAITRSNLLWHSVANQPSLSEESARELIGMHRHSHKLWSAYRRSYSGFPKDSAEREAAKNSPEAKAALDEYKAYMAEYEARCEAYGVQPGNY